jgi:hypothetical protein
MRGILQRLNELEAAVFPKKEKVKYRCLLCKPPKTFRTNEFLVKHLKKEHK